MSGISEMIEWFKLAVLHVFKLFVEGKFGLAFLALFGVAVFGWAIYAAIDFFLNFEKKGREVRKSSYVLGIIVFLPAGVGIIMAGIVYGDYAKGLVTGGPMLLVGGYLVLKLKNRFANKGVDVRKNE
ncbi:MAG: hypothetical protein ACE5KZ_14720 [Candidatus Scalinduaceae bacterium]